MACAKGCCATQREHYRSLGVASADRHSLTKTKTDDHGTHTVDVTQHFDGRQDVHVHAPRLTVRANTQLER
jgi:hypothetical protein